MLHATGTPQSFFSVPANGPKLLDQFRDAARLHGPPIRGLAGHLGYVYN